MIAEAATTEMNMEEGGRRGEVVVAPMVKVMLGEIEDDRDEGGDVGDRVG